MSKLIKTFTTVPLELFRLNNGMTVKIRARAGPLLNPQAKHDIATEAGLVKPKALDPSTYKPPNGLSMRPNTKIQQDLVVNYNGASVVVYTIPEGTGLPDDLILVHEANDHFSLQARREMTVEELGTKINEFLTANASCLTRQEWRKKYPVETVFMAGGDDTHEPPSSSTK